MVLRVPLLVYLFVFFFRGVSFHSGVVDGWTQTLRAQAGSRRRESRHPERHRAGEREAVENMNISTAKKEGRKESAVPLQGAFPTPSRGDPNHGILIRDHLFILLYLFGKP